MIGKLAPKAVLETARLWLRGWEEEDIAPFAALNADPRVMAHFPALLMPGQSLDLAVACHTHIQDYGFGLWAVERKSDRAFIGFCGLQTVRFEGPLNGKVEIGWRLAHKYWGQGLAHEAATVALAHGLAARAAGGLGLPSVHAFTTPANTRSLALMQRLGMARTPDLDFDHPKLPPGHRLRPHVVYVASTATESAD
jgi:RimJ/RimL family protein N-acetyltransferase